MVGVLQPALLVLPARGAAAWRPAVHPNVAARRNVLRPSSGSEEAGLDVLHAWAARGARCSSATASRHVCAPQTAPTAQQHLAGGAAGICGLLVVLVAPLHHRLAVVFCTLFCMALCCSCRCCSRCSRCCSRCSAACRYAGGHRVGQCLLCLSVPARAAVRRHRSGSSRGGGRRSSGGRQAAAATARRRRAMTSVVRWLAQHGGSVLITC